MNKKIIPMIFGGVCTLLGVILAIAWFPSYLFILLMIAGLIILFPAKKSLIKFKLFLQSFKVKKIYFFTVVLDAILWIVFFVLFALSAKIIEIKTTKLSSMQIASGSLEVMQQNIALAKSLIAYILIVFFVLILLSLIVYSITKYFVWSALLKKKFNKKKLLKFALLNLLWWILWGVLFMLLSSKASTEEWLLLKAIFSIKTVLLIIFYIYMTTKLHYTFLKTNSIKKSFTKAVESLSLLPKYLYPIATIIIVYFIFSIITMLLSFIMPANAIFYFHAGLFVLFIAWLRIYLISFIDKFKA